MSGYASLERALDFDLDLDLDLDLVLGLSVICEFLCRHFSVLVLLVLLVLLALLVLRVPLVVLFLLVLIIICVLVRIRGLMLFIVLGLVFIVVFVLRAHPISLFTQQLLPLYVRPIIRHWSFVVVSDTTAFRPIDSDMVSLSSPVLANI